MKTTCLLAPAVLAPALIALTALAATIDVGVSGPTGAPIENAVAYAIPKSGPAPFRKREVAVEQIDKTFVPFLTVVQTGTAVSFPNRDTIRHHVYSFSQPKPFELKLYVGTPAAPVVFDKPGEVVLGCNIHDQMLAYILVVDTPWFARTGATGRARIEGLPAGEYEVKLWHPAQALPAPEAKALRLRADETTPAAWKLQLRPIPPRSAPR